MNFPNATPDEWTAAHRMIAAAARRDGYDHVTMASASTADDIASEVVLRIMSIRWRDQPQSVKHAALILRKAARRLGWAMFDPEAKRARDRKQDMVRPVMDRGNMTTPSPDEMAMIAERFYIPVDRIHAAHGIGPGALAEPGHTPSVYGSGPATPTPVAGARFARLATDPNLDATLAARSGPAWREGPDLDHYRAQLAEYYAGR